MRLTESIRSAFVRAVLNDVPTVDHDAQVNKLLQDHLLSIAPPEVVRVHKDPKLRGYISVRQARIQLPTGGYTYPYLELIPEPDWQPKDKKLLDEIARLLAEKHGQYARLSDMREKLKATIRSFTTVESAKKALPELAKYLPDDQDKANRMVPAIANVIADLSKIGWPKGKEPPATKTEVVEKVAAKKGAKVVKAKAGKAVAA